MSRSGALIWLLAGATLFASESFHPAVAQECTATQARYDRPARPGRESDPDPVCLSELPWEAKQTLLLIKEGGPFPYDKDGLVFGNRERLLPLKPRDYYREYTVKTPESRDRGARRIVAGRSGEYYYTDDHYRSFRRILE